MTQIDTQTLTAEDGGRCLLTRVGEGSGPPVVMLPGLFDNRRPFLSGDGSGLAKTLAAAGFDPWILERRGMGLPHAPGARGGFEEALHRDVPLAQATVARANPLPAFWLGHSFGGVLLARALTQSLDLGQVAGVVLVNSAVDIPLLNSRVLGQVISTATRHGDLPARRLRLGPEDETAAAMADVVAWTSAERASGAVTKPLAGVTVPLLSLGSPRDPLTPAPRCFALAAAFGSTDRRTQLLGRRQGFRRDYGHEGPLLHRAAPGDVFAFLADWLRAHATPAPTEHPATVSPRPTADTGPGVQIVLSATVPASTEVVFDLLTERWGEIWNLRERRLRAGLDPLVPAGHRSARGIGVAPGVYLREEIVVHERPSRIDYTTHVGPFVRDHHATVHLREEPGSTVIDYRMRVQPAWWIPERLLAAHIKRTWMRHSVPTLHRLAASGAAAADPVEAI